jgi:hypothetical protein
VVFCPTITRVRPLKEGKTCEKLDTKRNSSIYIGSLANKVEVVAVPRMNVLMISRNYSDSRDHEKVSQDSHICQSYEEGVFAMVKSGIRRRISIGSE